jgi:uncharacterized protein involved in response to NO
VTGLPDALHPSPLWLSAFRPFYLLGAAYAPLLALAWLAAWLGHWVVPAGLPLKLVHGHEFIFGFAAAIILGVVLTALPSWAGTEEIDGGRLKLLVALWLAGRIGFWAAPWLPAPLPALADCLVYAVAMTMLAPQLLRVRNRLYLLLLPILAALFIANLTFHHAAVRGDVTLATLALRGAIWAIVVLYVLKGGVLAPIFTGNALREKGRGAQPPFLMPLEVAALAALLALAALDLGAAAPAWTGSAALACLLLYGWRSARWQGWRVADVPLLLPMHLGFAWLLLAFALKAGADLTGALPESAWLHAFTIGSLGLMMLGLMTRVSQRHTGRPLAMPPAMMLACAAMFLAAALRVAAGVGAGRTAISVATLLWAGAFVIYLGCYARVLVSPSLPRDTRDT